MVFRSREWARPGGSFADSSAYYKQKIDERTAAAGGEGYFGVVFHTGAALGDNPRIGWGRDDENSDLVIEPGMVFTSRPGCRSRPSPLPTAR